MWLDQAYPINAQEINVLIGLSMEGHDFTEEFERAGKHGKKLGEFSLYEIHGTKWGGCGVIICFIGDDRI